MLFIGQCSKNRLTSGPCLISLFIGWKICFVQLPNKACKLICESESRFTTYHFNRCCNAGDFSPSTANESVNRLYTPSTLPLLPIPATKPPSHTWPMCCLTIMTICPALVISSITFTASDVQPIACERQQHTWATVKARQGTVSKAGCWSTVVTSTVSAWRGDIKLCSQPGCWQTAATKNSIS